MQFGRTIAFLLLYRILCYYAPMCACSTLLSLSEISFFHLWHICFHMLLSCPIVSHHCSHNIPLAYAYAYAHSYHSVVCAEITESKGGVAGRKLMAWWHWGAAATPTRTTCQSSDGEMLVFTPRHQPPWHCPLGQDDGKRAGGKVMRWAVRVTHR